MSVSEGMENNSESGNEVELIIRNPNPPTHKKDLEIKTNLNITINDLKKKIENEYPGRPPVERQVLIFTGKVLKNPNMTMKEVLKNANGRGPFSLHLVIQSDGSSSGSGATTHGKNDMKNNQNSQAQNNFERSQEGESSSSSSHRNNIHQQPLVNLPLNQNIFQNTSSTNNIATK